MNVDNILQTDSTTHEQKKLKIKIVTNTLKKIDFGGVTIYCNENETTFYVKYAVKF